MQGKGLINFVIITEYYIKTLYVLLQCYSVYTAPIYQNLKSTTYSFKRIENKALSYCIVIFVFRPFNSFDFFISEYHELLELSRKFAVWACFSIYSRYFIK